MNRLKKGAWGIKVWGRWPSRVLPAYLAVGHLDKGFSSEVKTLEAQKKKTKKRKGEGVVLTVVFVRWQGEGSLPYPPNTCFLHGGGPELPTWGKETHGHEGTRLILDWKKWHHQRFIRQVGGQIPSGKVRRYRGSFRLGKVERPLFDQRDKAWGEGTKVAKWL